MKEIQQLYPLRRAYAMFGTQAQLVLYLLATAKLSRNIEDNIYRDCAVAILFVIDK